MREQQNDYILRRDGDITIVRLRTENLLGILDVQRVSRKLNALADAGTTRLVLDLKHVRFAGSAALGMLIELSQKTAAAGGRLILSHIEHIEPMLAASRTKKLFEIAADPHEAIKLFR